MGCINKKGELVIDYIYDNALIFDEEGYAIVNVDGLLGFIKEDGSWFLEPQFEDARQFSNGYAAVKLKDGQKIKK